MTLLLGPKFVSYVKPGVFQRCFYSWLMEVFNSKDVERVKKIGADRGAAEWAMRNGGKVLFAQHATWLTNYACLPSASGPQLIGIDLTDVAVTTSGLSHLEDLRHLKKLLLCGCRHITDLDYVTAVCDSLEHLDITRCSGVCRLTPVMQLRNLHTLIVSGTLPGVTNRDEIITSIRQSLPKCHVID